MTIAKEDASKITTTLAELDPWTIYGPDALIEWGFPPALVSSLVRQYESSRTDVKGMIWKDGVLVPATEGVYALELARAVSRELGVPYESAFGRGSEFRNIVTALQQWLRRTADAEPQRT